jgi:hypothetical protein
MQDALRTQERPRTGRSQRTMQPVGLEETLAEFVTDAAAVLQRDLDEGAEVGFELDSQRGGRGLAGPALYTYKPLTTTFIADRHPALERLDSHASAARVLGGFDGLERYLIGVGIDTTATSRGLRVRRAIEALLGEVFADQTDFELRPERLSAALRRLQQAGDAEDAAGITLVATLAGLAIVSEQVELTSTLTIARPETLDGLPPALLAELRDDEPGDLVAILVCDDQDPSAAIASGREILSDLLRSLRLFGDGRVSLGQLAWARIGSGAWGALALGGGGRPFGTLVVTEEQEDELRAFCNLVSRRAPHGNELAWALRRFELGCDRGLPDEALSDYLLALRVLLEPEGPAGAMLPGRLAALCAEPEQRVRLTERMVTALARERAVVAGEAVASGAALRLVEEVANHLRALLRDVICGHLDEDLAVLADEILLEPGDPADAEVDVEPPPAAAAPRAAPDAAEPPPAGPGEEDYPPLSVQEMLGEPGEPEEVLDLSV